MQELLLVCMAGDWGFVAACTADMLAHDQCTSLKELPLASDIARQHGVYFLGWH